MDQRGTVAATAKVIGKTTLPKDRPMVQGDLLLRRLQTKAGARTVHTSKVGLQWFRNKISGQETG